MKRLRILPSLFSCIFVFCLLFTNGIQVEATSVGVKHIKDNWTNYQDSTGSGLWTVYTKNGTPTLGTTSNVAWTGFLNPEAYKTVNATFEFDFYHDANLYRERGDAQGGFWDNDNIGWTFRHNVLDGNFNSYRNQEFYSFVMRGPMGCDRCGGSAPSRSGLYKKVPGGFMGSAFDEDNTTPYPREQMILLAPIDMVWEPNREYHAKVQIQDESNGARIRVWVDGRQIVNYLDRDPIPMGTYGPFTHSLAYGYFKNIKVNGVSIFNAPPKVILSAPSNNSLYGGSDTTLNVRGNVTDPDKKGDYTLYYAFNYPENGTRFASGRLSSSPSSFNGNIPISELTNGEHKLYIWATDETGAISDKVERTIRIDKTAPSLTLTQTPTAWTKANVTIQASGSDTGLAGFDYIVTPNNDRVNSTSTNYMVSSNGSYTFYAYDKAGNRTSRTINISNIDKTAPSVSFGTNGNNTYEKSHSTRVTVSDSQSGVKTRQYVWSSSTNQPTSGWTDFNNGATLTTPNGTGTRYLWIKATDQVGNTTYVRSNGFRIDNTKPTGTITATPTDWTKGQVIIQLRNLSDQHSGYYRVRTPNGDFFTTSSINYAVGENGLYSFIIYDRAGNTETKQIQISNIDRTKPQLNIIETSRNNSRINVRLEYAD